MGDKPLLTVIIPAYNEEETIGEVVGKTRTLSKDYEILVVDDGSTDGTALMAREAGAKVISHPYNIGNGAAVKTGVRHASSDFLLMMDGDGQHDAKEIPKLMEYLGEYDMVVGARISKSDVSSFRTFGNRLLNRVANVLAERKIPDLTSGFRAIKKEKMEEFLHLLPNKYSYPTTITLAMMKSGYFAKYVPLDSIQRRKSGKSHIKPFRDGFRFLLIITRVIMLFDPLKVFVPASLALLFIGVTLAIVNLIVAGGIQGSSVLTILTSIFIFFFGFLADQSARIRRELNRVGK